MKNTFFSKKYYLHTIKYILNIHTSELGMKANSSANKCGRLSRNVIGLFFCELMRLRTFRMSVDVSILLTFSSGSQFSISF